MIDIITGTDGAEKLTGTESKKGRVIGWILVLLCLAGAAGGAYWIKTHAKPAVVTDAAASADAVRAADAQMAKAAAAHDVQGTIAFYSDDAVVMPPNQPMVHDKLSEAKAWTAILAPGAEMSWTAGKIDAAQSGELVYDVGVYTVITKSGKGKAQTQTTDGGKYLAVWRKQADGTWKCVADTWNSDKAAAAGKK